MTAAQRWDLSSFFPSFESAERAAFETTLATEAASALATAQALGPLEATSSEAHAAAWADVVVRYEALLARFSHLSSYTTALASCDPDERYRLAEARLDGLRSTIDKLVVELRRMLGAASDDAARAFYGRAELAGATYALERLRHEAKTSMTPELEGLAADLAPDGIFGWGRLYDGLAAKLTFAMRWPDGREARVPMAQRRSLMADADRRVRQAAFEAGNVAWREVEDVTAAALNHLAGTRHTLNARRGVGHFLDVALHQAGITRRTLDAMLEAVQGRAELPRRGLKLKARAMGLDAIAWYDLEAPLPLGDGDRLGWDEGVRLVRASFDAAYPRLGAHLGAMLERRWIESEARVGKRPGAYCTASDTTGESRVFMTYQGSLGDVSTLAHEVGHAWHAEVMRETRVLARQYPMTLAETASTFGEALLSDGLLADRGSSDARRALLLGELVGDGAAFLLDVPTRFEFERRFYEERRAGELAPSQLDALMRSAQRDVFGDCLAVGEEDPCFWASKLHFFIADLTFYNFPYTFGFLLSRGLYSMWKAEGADFLPRYEAFLRATGSGMAHEVARATLGRDLEDAAFWVEAIDTLAAPTAELERLLTKLGRLGTR
jgi:oligoendopeptidase F